MSAPTSPAVDSQLLDEAVALAREAGEHTLRWFGVDDLVVDRKGDGTPVTEADRATERLVRDRLGESHPNDAIIGEEEVDQPGTSGRRWIIDPIDGTKAFTHGVPLYSTLLAVEDEHGPAIGVIVLPALNEIVYAGRGSRVLPQWSTRARERAGSTTRQLPDDIGIRLLARDHARPRSQRRACSCELGATATATRSVATGRVEAMVDPSAAQWDLAAMPVIIGEAGGRFTDYTGAERADGGNGVATNGRLHEEVLALLN